MTKAAAIKNLCARMDHGYEMLIVARPGKDGVRYFGIKNLGFGRYLYIEAYRKEEARRKKRPKSGGRDVDEAAPVMSLMDAISGHGFGIAVKTGCTFVRADRNRFMARVVPHLGRPETTVFLAKRGRKAEKQKTFS